MTALSTITRGEWLRFFFVANELRGFTSLCRLSPDLVHTYVEGFGKVPYILSHLDVAIRLLLGG